MAHTYEHIIKSLEKGTYDTCYFLCGDEPFYLDRITAYIEKHLLSKIEKGFNLHIVYGKEVSVSQVVELAGKFPMMAKRQVVIIKEAQEIQDIHKKEAQSLLLNYLNRQLSSTVLVLVYKSKKLPSGNDFQKQIKKHTTFFLAKKIYDNRLTAWIIQYCRQENIKVTAPAATVLAEYIGNDLSRIIHEIDKVLVGKNKAQFIINEDFVSEHIGSSKKYNIFELQTALAHKDILKAHRIIYYFEMNPKDHPVIPMVALLFNYFIKILLLHQNSGKSEGELKSITGLDVHSPYIIKDYITARKNYSLYQVLTIISYLHKADLCLKGIGSVASPSQILKELIFKITHV